MRKRRSGSIASALLLVVVASACGSSESDGGAAADPATSPAAEAPADPATTISEDGVYEAGVDILAGVWTTTSSSEDPCLAATATSADYDVADEEAEGGDLVAVATSNGSGLVIEVGDGEFLSTSSCNPWTLEDDESDDGEAATDPATLEGGCEILLGDDGALDAALAFRDSGDDDERTRVQERIFAIVTAENESLADPAGQLVDYLDDPDAYIEDGKLSSTITTAVSDIRETCDVL
ncbi:MAG: hypothetical protein ABW004_12095 [Aeromicrobium sp.]